MKLKLIFPLCLLLCSISVAATQIHAQDVGAQGAQGKVAEADADPAAGIKKRLGQLKIQLKDLRTKPHVLAPGEAVGLNPQPEPPGKARSGKVNSKGDEVTLNPQPEPPGSAPDLLRKMRASLGSVEADLTKLSLSANANLKLRAKLDEAQVSLNHYEKASDQKSTNVALDEFSNALQALSKMAESYIK